MPTARDSLQPFTMSNHTAALTRSLLRDVGFYNEMPIILSQI